MLKDLQDKGKEFVDEIIEQETQHLKSLSKELRNEGSALKKESIGKEVN